MNPVTPLYDDDFYAWTQHQAALRRTKKWQEIDYPNLAPLVFSGGEGYKYEDDACINSAV